MATPECLGARLLDEVGGGGLDEVSLITIFEVSPTFLFPTLHSTPLRFPGGRNLSVVVIYVPFNIKYLDD